MKAEYINHMGDDLTVVNAARVSFDKESDWVQRPYAGDETGEYLDEELPLRYEPFENYHLAFDDQGRELSEPVLSKRDTKLISYLARHGHWTPFSHPQITLRYTVPIFVARQEFKHIVGFTRNEISRRYVDDAPEFYVPEAWRKRAENKKQGSSEETVDAVYHWGTMCAVAPVYDTYLKEMTGFYDALLKAGVCPEQARMVLPQSMYTSYYVTGSLAAFARFYKQRTDAHAQKEIQDLAHMVGAIIQPLFPVSWEALTQ